MAPTRLRLLRRAGWRLPPGAVSVAYPTRWANPYRPAERSAAANAEAVRLYRVWLAERMAADPAFLEPLRQATGLACFCPLDLPCHADVLIELLEGRTHERGRGQGISWRPPSAQPGQDRRLEDHPHTEWPLAGDRPGRCWLHRGAAANREGPDRRRGRNGQDRAAAPIHRRHGAGLTEDRVMTGYARLMALPQVIANKAYFDELAELARAAVDAAAKLPSPYDTEAQADAVVDQLPPPVAVHPVLAGAFVRYEIGHYLHKQAEFENRLADLAEMAGCPEDEPMLQWLLQQGLIRVRDDRVEIVVPS